MQAFSRHLIVAGALAMGLAAPAIAKEYVREGFVDLDRNNSLMEPIDQGKQYLTEQLRDELWSLNQRREQMQQQDGAYQYFLTDKQQGQLIKLTDVIDSQRLGSVLYIKAKFDVNEAKFVAASAQNASASKRLATSISFQGSELDSKSEIMRQAVNSAKMEVLERMSLYVDQQSNFFTQGITQSISDQIETVTDGVIRVSAINNLQWHFNQVSFDIRFDYFPSGVTERWRTNKDTFLRTVDNYRYTKQPIAPYKAQAASTHFYQGVMAVEQLVLDPANADAKQARQLFAADAKTSGDVDAYTMTCLLGGYYAIELEQPQSVNFDDCLTAARKGSTIAQLLLGSQLAVGKYLTEDRSAAHFWLTTGLDNHRKGNIYYQQHRGKTDKVFPASMDLMGQAVIEASYFQLASMYETGRGAPQNIDVAVQLYKRCALLPLASGRCALHLGELYQEGQNGLKADWQQADYWYGKSSSEQGDLKRIAMLQRNQDANFNDISANRRAELVRHRVGAYYNSFDRNKFNFEGVHTQRSAVVSNDTFDRIDFERAITFAVEQFYDQFTPTQQQALVDYCVLKIEAPACMWRYGQRALQQSDYASALAFFTHSIEAGSTLAYLDYATLINDSLHQQLFAVNATQLHQMMRILRTLTEQGDKHATTLRRYWINKYESQASYVDMRKNNGLPAFTPYKL